MTFARALLASVTVLLALAAGLYLGGHPAELPEPVRDVFVEEQTSLQADTFKLIEDNYVRAVPARRLQNGSLNGIVESLHDRFSSYLTPGQRKVFQQSIGGEFSGVGMTVMQHRRGLLVTSLFERSPAKRGGIKPGDLITAVNGRSIAGESSNVSTARIKGRPGTFVDLTVITPRNGKKRRRRRELRLKRARIKIPVVEDSLRRIGARRFGVVRLASFTTDVSAEVRVAVDGLLARRIRGLVLDLRGNPGGLLQQAVLVSSIFVPRGTVVVTKGRKRPRRVLRATGRAIDRIPLVVLVDRGTASAGEIVTAALNERLGAPVVGQRTFGKGVFGEVFGLPNGGAVDLTVGNYFTPDGRNLAGRGIKPDVRVVDDPGSRTDEQLEKALDVLAGEERRSVLRR